MKALLAALLLPLWMARPAMAQDEGAFVSVQEVDATIVVDARYAGSYNFIGEPVAGYQAPKCILSREAADALARAQTEFRTYGLSIKTFDCYRPQTAVNHFVEWARDLDDDRMKSIFYPDVDKSVLFEQGYIADRSGHSRGSTIDLTIVPLHAVPQARDRNDGGDCRRSVDPSIAPSMIDMGTAYDCFDPLSHTANPAISSDARRNRLLLKAVMERFGFVNYDQEWWHFTLAGEPYPDRYFDFPVE